MISRVYFDSLKYICNDTSSPILDKPSFYIKNLGDQTQEVVFSYQTNPEIAEKFIKNLSCPCLSRRIIKPNEEQKILIHFLIDSDIEDIAEHEGQLPVNIIAEIMVQK